MRHQGRSTALNLQSRLAVIEAQLEFGFGLYHCATEAYFSDYMEFAPQQYESFRKAAGDGVAMGPVPLNAMTHRTLLDSLSSWMR